MKPRVVLVQLPIPPLAPGLVSGNGPLAAGSLALRALRLGLGEHYEIQILSPAILNEMGDRALLAEILAREPALVGFTCYLWNVERTIALAEALKAERPQVDIIFGGPEITRDNAWVLDSEAVDYAAFGEGEQTFADLLTAGAAGQAPVGIPGLFVRGGDPSSVIPRSPLPNLDLVTSPYEEGLLDLAGEGLLALETIRGCVFNCGFCYYPKSYDSLYYLSEDKIRSSLRHARSQGVREVFLLDPTLNQRRDFARFLGLLAEENDDGFFEFHAELRAEGLKEEHARLMQVARFKEVEVGLQSTDAHAQELMDRKNNLRAFENGVRYLRDHGVKVKTDLIVGLPGDTADSIRRGMDWVAERELFDTIQVFQLAVLPGTSFRMNAKSLGLVHQARPPYFVLKTPALELEQILELVDEAEAIFDTNFDPLPDPVLVPPVGRYAATEATFDLDDGGHHELPDSIASAFSLRLRTRAPFATLPSAARLLGDCVASEPFATLQVILETDADFPLDVYDALIDAAERPRELYLDRVHAFLPGAQRATLRFVTILPERARASLDADWLEAAEDYSAILFQPSP